MRGLAGQRGMTFIGWLIVLGLIAFFTLITLRLAPIYFDNYKVKSVLKSLQDEPNVTQKSPADIRDLISRRFDVNSIDDITARQVTIQNQDGVLTVEAKYDVRTPMLGNVAAVVSFDNKVEVIAH